MPSSQVHITMDRSYIWHKAPYSISNYIATISKSLQFSQFHHVDEVHNNYVIFVICAVLFNQENISLYGKLSANHKQVAFKFCQFPLLRHLLQCLGPRMKTDHSSLRWQQLHHAQSDNGTAPYSQAVASMMPRSQITRQLVFAELATSK